MGRKVHRIREAQERSDAEARSETSKGRYLEGEKRPGKERGPSALTMRGGLNASSRCLNPRSRPGASPATTRRTLRAERLPGLRLGRNLRRDESPRTVLARNKARKADAEQSVEEVRNLEDVAEPGEANLVELEARNASRVWKAGRCSCRYVEGPQGLQEGERRDSREPIGAHCIQGRLRT